MPPITLPYDTQQPQVNAGIAMGPPQPAMPSMAAVPNGANPILDSISALPPEAHQALMQAHQQVVDHHVNQARMAPPAPAMPSMGNPDPNGSLRPGGTTDAMPAMPPEQAQHVMGPPQPGTIGGAEQHTADLMAAPSGVSQIHSKIEGSEFGQNHPFLGKLLGWGAQIPAQIGADALHLAAPNVAKMVPGTEDNRQANIARSEKEVAGLQGERKADTADDATKAETGLRNVQAEELPKTNEAKQELADEKVRHNQEVESEAQRRQGLGPDGKPIPYEQLTPHEQGIQDVQKAHQEELEATAEYKKYQSNPNTPQARAALARVQNAQANQALGWAKLQQGSQRLDFQQEKFYNPQPTGTERNKGDMANSSITQIGDMRDVVNRRPDIFGPGPGRANKFQQWLGSSDPDAMKYRSSAQYLADHSAAMFGGRSEYVMQQLHGLTDEKFTPAAINSALDQAEKTSRGFQEAGTVHGKGGKSGYGVPMSEHNNSAASAAPGGTKHLVDPDTGREFDIPSDKIDAFKKRFPNAK